MKKKNILKAVCLITALTFTTACGAGSSFDKQLVLENMQGSLAENEKVVGLLERGSSDSVDAESSSLEAPASAKENTGSTASSSDAASLASEETTSGSTENDNRGSGDQGSTQGNTADSTQTTESELTVDAGYYLSSGLADVTGGNNGSTVVDMTETGSGTITHSIDSEGNEVYEFRSSETKAPDVITDSSSDDENSEALEVSTTDITILILNECGMDIGTVAIIDPVSGDQVNIGSIDTDEMIILELKWPSNGRKFKIAAYDTDGKIIKAGSCDFSSITLDAVITFEGEGTVTQISSETE